MNTGKAVVTGECERNAVCGSAGVLVTACVEEEDRGNTGSPITWSSARPTGRPRGTGRARWGGGEARSTVEVGSCRWRKGASVQDQRKKREGTGDWETYTHSRNVQRLRKALHAEAKEELRHGTGARETGGASKSWDQYSCLRRLRQWLGKVLGKGKALPQSVLQQAVGTGQFADKKNP